MKFPLFSVIAVFYKDDLYIKQCLESIINQSYKDFELIIILNGATDECVRIANEYSNYNNITIIKLENNIGISNSRNTALDIARGEYIIFCDGDDYFRDLYFFELVKNKISENNCDVLFFKSIHFIQNGHYYDKEPLKINESLHDEELIKNLIKNNSLGIACWSKVVRNKIIQDNIIRFIDKNCEDLDWTFDLLNVSKKYSYTNNLGYVHRMHSQSTAMNTNKTFNGTMDVLQTCKKYFLQYVEKKEEQYKISYFSYQLFIALSNYPKLKKEDKRIVKLTIKNMLEILDFSYDNKSILCRKLIHVFGISVTAHICYLYVKKVRRR